MNREVKSVIENLLKKNSGSFDFVGEFYQTFKEKLTPILLKLFQKAEEGMLPNLF